ncbi:cobalamin B12-binding domain-containing protein [Thalassobacillus hwangdonensis]|uniref:B12-binding domain-containing protein n=1 Tax=Thalassobacillus hwangdonensis TaxID=546108 RepID=A0ABW3L4T8_9BACI
MHIRLAELFLSGEEETAVDFIEKHLNEHPRMYLYEDIITPAMYHIGELWENNEISVADEHLATAVCDFVLSKIENTSYPMSTKKLGDRKVMLLGIENERHYIGLKMVSSYFKEKNWRVRYLGPDLPIDHAIKQIDKWKPDVIGLSAALSYRLPVLKVFIERFSKLEWQPDILVGGRITRKYDLTDMYDDHVHFIRGLNDLDKWLVDRKEGIKDGTS